MLPPRPYKLSSFDDPASFGYRPAIRSDGSSYSRDKLGVIDPFSVVKSVVGVGSKLKSMGPKLKSVFSRGKAAPARPAAGGTGASKVAPAAAAATKTTGRAGLGRGQRLARGAGRMLGRGVRDPLGAGMYGYMGYQGLQGLYQGLRGPTEQGGGGSTSSQSQGSTQATAASQASAQSSGPQWSGPVRVQRTIRPENADARALRAQTHRRPATPAPPPAAPSPPVKSEFDRLMELSRLEYEREMEEANFANRFKQ